ncbi:DNA-directed RNA polymerase III subunit C1 (rpo31) [Dimargaris xerosporica]|nr:DNA-directed RNA polymerase III subunit C1 (rpo31) [Dimargaris xerosporica]
MKELVTDTVPKKIKHIHFSVLSPDEIRLASELEVTQRDLYDVPTRKPIKHGVLDRRLGTSDKQATCETCGLKMADCIGHFGHLDLCLPIFHIGYFKTVITILQNICKTCSRVLLEEPDRRKYLQRYRSPTLDNIQRRLISKAVNTQCRKVVHCLYCGAINGVVKKASGLKIVHEKYRAKKVAGDLAQFRKSFDNAVAGAPELKTHVSKAQEDLNPLRVLQLFEKVSAEDCELLGLDPMSGRPETFIWRSIPVPPVCIRPSVAQEAASNEDDLTAKLAEITFINGLIKNALQRGEPLGMLVEQWENMQIAAAMYINSTVPGVPFQANMKPIRGLCQRLKGKQGRFRGNLSGKRVDFSGRTVISPDPNLRIDEVGIPVLMAKVLTFPERVFEHNMERMKRLVRNGPDVHPGANFVVKKSNGIKRFLMYVDRQKFAETLEIGDVVERHINDGDVVLFNRQPSLHRMSIMAHLVRVKPWRTLRFNECVCSPYNADFDGDEMNIHVPQTEEARMEALELMGVKNNLVTPRNGEMLITATQDFITASYLISHKDTFYDRSQFTQLCCYFCDALEPIDIPAPAIHKPMQLWTGKQLFSVMLRPNRNSPVLVNLRAKNKSFSGFDKGPPELCPNDGYVVIHNSQVMAGLMDKSVVGGSKSSSVLFFILKNYGGVAAAEAMNRLAKLCARWLGNRGFSIGINDVQAPLNLQRLKDEQIDAAYSQCDDLIGADKLGRITTLPGQSKAQTLETKISGVLNEVREAAGGTCSRELSRHNAPMIMANCGSKGSKINVCQMVACVGQQIISNNRIKDGFMDRTLPHFEKHSVAPAARGFVRNSFYTGLTPTEFLFHAMSGREGLVDTAVKTAETGYMQRRLMKTFEDLTAHYDLSVRAASGQVLQFYYGGDGLDPTTLEGDGTPIVFDRDLLHIQGIKQPQPGDKPLLPFQIAAITKKTLAQARFKTHCHPAFLEQLGQFIQKKMVEQLGTIRTECELESLVDPPKTTRMLNRLLKDEDPVSVRAAHNRLCITEELLTTYLESCYRKYHRAKVEPGTAVGALGAMSLGEPTTQMTLRTFHFSGVASMNVTMGVPRLKELMNASKNISTPIITCQLVDKKSETAARIIKGRLERTILGDITEYIEEVYRAGECYLSLKISMQTIQRLHLETNLVRVAQAITSHSKLKLPEANVQAHKPDRIRVYPNPKDPSDMYFAMQALKRALPAVNVVGIPTIKHAVVCQDKDGYIVQAEGTGLNEVMGIDGVVGVASESNHVMELANVLGIEAAAHMVILQIQSIFKTYSITIDERHLWLLADIMTFKGEVLGVNRFGLAKMKDSVLMLASFEKTTDHLFDAAAFGKKDAIVGVSECIIMGIPMPIGTGLFKLIQETAKPRPTPKAVLFDQMNGQIKL